MDILVYLLLALAAAAVVCSLLLTVGIFKCFGGDDPEKTRQNLIKYRKRMIISYAAAVLLITAAAVVKIVT